MPGALLAALLACAPTPDAARWSVIELRGTPVGWIEARERDGVVERARHLRVLEAGRVVEHSALLWTEHGPRGEVLSVCRPGAGDACWRAGAEPVWLPEHAPEGEHLLLDTWSGAAERVTVVDGRFRLGGLAWEVGDGVVRAGPLTFRDVGARPTVQAVDPGRLVARPAAAAAPSPRVARFRVDGVEREVRRPLPLELAAADRAVLERLARSDRRGDCKARARDAAEAAAALGLEARVVHGLARVDGALVPHAWIEVLLGGIPVAVDPALDQPIADATHLPLTPAELLASEVELLDAR